MVILFGTEEESHEESHELGFDTNFLSVLRSVSPCLQELLHRAIATGTVTQGYSYRNCYTGL